MNRKVLLTGCPGCGKTTLVGRVVKELAQSAGGFYTEEIRKRRERVGFKIVTLEGKEGVFAHVNFKTQQRLGKYGLDLSPLETIDVEAVREALCARQLTVIDEIGAAPKRMARPRAYFPSLQPHPLISTSPSTSTAALKGSSAIPTALRA